MSGRLQGLLEDRASHQAVERELAIARDVQQRLFPERTPFAPFLEAAGTCVPARTVSGDYYDFIEVAGGWDTVVADVSGKGMSAALLMASLHSALRSLYLRHGRHPLPDIGEVTTHLNDHFNHYLEPERFVTLFLARYRGDGRLDYCNAGHNPAARVRDGRVDWLTSGGLMLGPFPDLEYRPATIAVQPGDLLCIYTDGVTESESPRGEQFGEERLASALCEVAHESPREAMARIQQRVRAWRGDREPGDDLTLVLLRIL
jgi:sigma-B regulation protein RsbU (phosphoserine phosphatase)